MNPRIAERFAAGRSFGVIRIIRARDEAASRIDVELESPAGLHRSIALARRFEFPFGEGLEDRFFGNRLDFSDDPEVGGIAFGSDCELDFAVGRGRKRAGKIGFRDGPEQRRFRVHGFFEGHGARYESSEPGSSEIEIQFNGDDAFRTAGGEDPFRDTGNRCFVHAIAKRFQDFDFGGMSFGRDSELKSDVSAKAEEACVIWVSDVGLV